METETSTTETWAERCDRVATELAATLDMPRVQYGRLLQQCPRCKAGHYGSSGDYGNPYVCASCNITAMADRACTCGDHRTCGECMRRHAEGQRLDRHGRWGVR